MTDRPITPPPHLLKKFSEQAREDSKKRGHPGYCKTFAKLCIDWALNSTSMPELSPASLEVWSRYCSIVEEYGPPRLALAAALRAAADQVVPPALEEEWRDRNQASPLTKMVEIRLKLLAIADELEAQ